MSYKMLIIPLSQRSGGWFYLFSTDECEQMFLRDSPLTSRDVDVSCRTFSACFSSFDVVRKSCYRPDAADTTTGGVRWLRLMPRDVFVNTTCVFYEPWWIFALWPKNSEPSAAPSSVSKPGCDWMIF